MRVSQATINSRQMQFKSLGTNASLASRQYDETFNVKLQFDPNQRFQLDAVAAVTELFDGQPQGAPEYAVINVGAMEGLFAGQDQSELGLGNRLFLAEDKLRANLRAIQMRNDIEVANPDAAPEAWELFDAPANQARACPHFSV